MQIMSAAPMPRCSGPISSLLFDFDDEVSELLSVLHKQLMRSVRGNMNGIAGGKFVTFSTVDLRTTDFTRCGRLGFDDSATDDEGRFAALYNKEVGYCFVQLSSAVAFAMADHRTMISPCAKLLTGEFLRVNLWL